MGSGAAGDTGPGRPRVRAQVEAFTRARGADWCTAALGRSFAGLRHATVAEAELLRLAHERNLDPPLPDEIAAARQEAADHRTLVAHQRQQQRDHDWRERTAAQRQANGRRYAGRPTPANAANRYAVAAIKTRHSE